MRVPRPRNPGRPRRRSPDRSPTGTPHHPLAPGWCLPFRKSRPHRLRDMAIPIKRHQGSRVETDQFPCARDGDPIVGHELAASGAADRSAQSKVVARACTSPPWFGGPGSGTAPSGSHGLSRVTSSRPQEFALETLHDSVVAEIEELLAENRADWVTLSNVAVEVPSTTKCAIASRSIWPVMNVNKVAKHTTAASDRKPPSPKSVSTPSASRAPSPDPPSPRCVDTPGCAAKTRRASEWSFRRSWRRRQFAVLLMRGDGSIRGGLARSLPTIARFPLGQLAELFGYSSAGGEGD